MEEKLDIDKRLDRFMLGMEELRKSQDKTDEQLKQTDAQLKKTDAQLQKTDEQLKQTDEQLKQTDEQLKRTDAQLKRTDAKFDKSLKRWEGFIGNYADATEEYFYRSLEDTMKLGHISFEDIQRKVSITNSHVEFDIVLINGNSIGIVEVKSKAHPKDIQTMISKKIQHFKIDYPEYADYKYYFGIASLITNEDMEREARENGIFLLTQKGEHLEVVGDGVRSY